MTTTGDVIRKLFIAHVRSDDAAFRAAASELIGNERRINRVTFANELERIMSEARPNGRRNSSGTRSAFFGAEPRDRDKDAALVELTEPVRELDDLILTSGVRAELDRVAGEWRKTDLLRAHGLRPVSKVLFHGPPGVGKSAAAEVLARQLFLPLATVRFDAVVSSYLGETAANLRKVFDYARTRPVVLFFDEFDAVGKRRGASDEHGELKRVVNSFLQLLDGFRSDSVTVAATNHEGLLDPALWRRFDSVVAFPLPGPAEIESLLVRLLRQVPLTAGVRLPEVVRQLTGTSHADVERVAIESIKAAVMAGRNRVEFVDIQPALSRLEARKQVTIEADRATQPRPAVRRRRKTD